MRTTPQFRGFLAIAGLLSLAALASAWFRWRGQAPERSAWEAVQSDLGAQSARVDSLKQVLDRLEGGLDAGKRAVASAGERLEHAARQAVAGRLSEPDHRRYLQEIERHNHAVDAHNAALIEMRRVHAEYSAAVDTHNALVDSANALQVRAVQEGIQLSAPEP